MLGCITWVLLELGIYLEFALGLEWRQHGLDISLNIIGQLKLFIYSCVAPKIRIFLAAVPGFGEKLWHNSIFLKIPFGNSCPERELCSPCS